VITASAPAEANALLEVNTSTEAGVTAGKGVVVPPVVGVPPDDDPELPPPPPHAKSSDSSMAPMMNFKYRIFYFLDPE
jgi:hypothetical protein